MQGVAVRDIASRLQLNERTVEDLLARGGAAPEHNSTESFALPEDSSRREAADHLLKSLDILSVGTGDEIEGDADVGVGYADLAAHDFSDFVDEDLRLIRSRPGVEHAEREDREFIAVYGSGC
jgi:hypothetical protein